MARGVFDVLEPAASNQNVVATVQAVTDRALAQRASSIEHRASSIETSFVES
jgi:DNA repair photolyase